MSRLGQLRAPAWLGTRFREVPHPFGRSVAIVEVELPSDAAIPPNAITPDERDRAARTTDRSDAGRFLASRALLRSVLADVLGRPCTDIQWCADAFGKPRLADEALHFNMSRSGSVALIAASDRFELGVDAERVREVPGMSAVTREIFSPRERADWERIEAASAVTAFLQCWTRKEACLKAAGVGLAVAPANVDVGWAEPSRLREVSLTRGDGRWDVAVCSLATSPGVVGAAAFVTRSSAARLGSADR